MGHLAGVNSQVDGFVRQGLQFAAAGMKLNGFMKEGEREKERGERERERERENREREKKRERKGHRARGRRNHS